MVGEQVLFISNRAYVFKFRNYNKYCFHFGLQRCHVFVAKLGEIWLSGVRALSWGMSSVICEDNDTLESTMSCLGPRDNTPAAMSHTACNSRKRVDPNCVCGLRSEMFYVHVVESRQNVHSSSLIIAYSSSPSSHD